MPIVPTKKIWLDNELIDWEDAKIHLLTHSLHYGLGVFEGIRAYDTKHGAAIFRGYDHMARLVDSARVFLIDLPYTPTQLLEATKVLLRENEISSCYIRPIAFLGYGEMGLNPLGSKVHVAIAAWPWRTYLGEEGLQKGIRIKVSSWQRFTQNTIPISAKCTGMYANSALAKVEAIKSGYDEALMLNSQGFVSECSGENIFIVKDSTLITPPTSEAGALKGITRDSVIAIARDLGVETKELMLTRSDLYLADEAFLTGTAAEVVPINSVDDRVVGMGRPGEITLEIQKVFFGAAKGEVEKYKDWLDYVN